MLKLGRRLASQYQVTRYDRRGYGRSASLGSPFDIANQVDDLIAVIERIGDEIRPSVLVGHSYGGNVALALAARRPDLVDGVVTYETPMSWCEWWPNDSAGASAVAMQADPAEAAERFMRRLIGDQRWERLPESTKRSRRNEGQAMVGELIDLRVGAPWSGSAIGVPVLAMHGELGKPYHRRGAETVASEIDGAEVVAVPGAKHPGPNTHPDAVAGLIAEFVDRRVRSSAAGSD